jgi:hypothetical protein
LDDFDEKEQGMERERLSKVFMMVTVISGFAAAYLMYRRGESLGAIARKSITNPLGTLASEVGNVVISGRS